MYHLCQCIYILLIHNHQMIFFLGSCIWWLFAGKAVCGEMKSRIARSKRMVVLAIRRADISRFYKDTLWYCDMISRTYKMQTSYVHCSISHIYIYTYRYVYIYIHIRTCIFVYTCTCAQDKMRSFREVVLVPGQNVWMVRAAVGGVCVVAPFGILTDYGESLDLAGLWEYCQAILLNTAEFDKKTCTYTHTCCWFQQATWKRAVQSSLCILPGT